MPEETDDELPPLDTDDEEDPANGDAVHPADYVYTSDFSHMVVLRDGTDSRAWRVWDVILEQFRDMGATRTSVKADAWRLQHDAGFHHSWAVELPMWGPDLATYVPVSCGSTGSEEEGEIGAAEDEMDGLPDLESDASEEEDEIGAAGEAAAALGFTHFYERAEYQSRGSAHRHAIWWRET